MKPPASSIPSTAPRSTFSRWRGLRVGLALLLFLISLLAIFPAPTFFLWHIAIAASEFGHWLILLPLGVLLWEWAAGGHPLRQLSTAATTLLGLAATLLFLVPASLAQMQAQTLPDQLTAAFGPVNAPALTAAPFSLGELWSPPSDPPVRQQTLQFVCRDGSAQPINLYTSSTAQGPRPLILLVHGGGWNSGAPDQLSAFSCHLASWGYVVASVGYRLAPQAQWPAQKEDVTDAYAFLKGSAATLDIDPTRCVVMGRSAGGQIALATAYPWHDPAVRGCIDLYAPTDMNFAYTYGSENDMLHSHQLVRDFMGGAPDDDRSRAAYLDASPLAFVGNLTPPRSSSGHAG